MSINGTFVVDSVVHGFDTTAANAISRFGRAISSVSSLSAKSLPSRASVSSAVRSRRLAKSRAVPVIQFGLQGKIQGEIQGEIQGKIGRTILYAEGFVNCEGTPPAS